jgi:ABC-type uncharacterized transport system substrate-binding protein
MAVAVLAGLGPVAAAAHPHIWIDTSVEVVLDDQDRAVAVRIGWTYDEFYSLFITSDMGLDPDGDALLTPEEVAKLAGFDMHWLPGFEGDSYAFLDEAPLALGPPEDWGAAYAAGKITTTHLRRLETPVPVGAATFFVEIYDPGFYTAYTVLPYARLTGGTGACKAEVWGPDLDAADEALKAALAEYSADQDVEADFPAIGKQYAEEVRVTCAAP